MKKLQLSIFLAMLFKVSIPSVATDVTTIADMPDNHLPEIAGTTDSSYPGDYSEDVIAVSYLIQGYWLKNQVMEKIFWFVLPEARYYRQYRTIRLE